MAQSLRPFKLHRPSNVKQAVDMLIKNENGLICAGGTDLIVNMRHGLAETDALVDVSNIIEMQQLQFDDVGLRIGASVTLATLAQEKTIAEAFPALHQACLAIAGPSHRNKATVGGNLCLDTRCLYYNQSHWWRQSNDFCLKYKGDICHVAPKGARCRAAFCGDLAAVLIALDAEVEIAGPHGLRDLPVKDLYVEDGAAHLALEQREIVTSVLIAAPNSQCAYEKVRVRGAVDFPLAGVCVVCEKNANEGARFAVAVTGTNSAPIGIDIPALTKNDNKDAFFDELAKQVKKAVSPQRTTTVAPHYRRLSISALAKRLAKQLYQHD
jgi:4-hydroxybenzoyl-CoA reductase subunit beta